MVNFIKFIMMIVFNIFIASIIASFILFMIYISIIGYESSEISLDKYKKLYESVSKTDLADELLIGSFSDNKITEAEYKHIMLKINKQNLSDIVENKKKTN